MCVYMCTGIYVYSNTSNAQFDDNIMNYEIPKTTSPLWLYFTYNNIEVACYWVLLRSMTLFLAFDYIFHI